MEILASHLHYFIDYALLRSIPQDGTGQLTEKIELVSKENTATVNADLFYAVLALISTSLNDELLGIRMGRFLNLNALGLVYKLSLQASTIEEGLYYLKSFINASFPIIKIRDYKTGKNYTIELAIENDKRDLNRIILESVQMIIKKELTMMSASELSIRITSPYCNKLYPKEYSLGETYTITFPEITLKATIKAYGQKQLDFLIPQYLKLIESLKQHPTFINKVKIATLNMACPALPGLNEIAESFNLAPRTFQRLLAAEQVTFRQIADDLKKEISILLLKNKTYTVADVCYLLGYSEPAAFLHSFKKWYGVSPSMAKI